MGFAKWLLKNGPGSPGSTAKVYCKQYNKLSKGNHKIDWLYIFQDLYNKRTQVSISNSGDLLRQVDLNEIINYSEGDLPLFIFEMMYYETSNFREGARNRETLLLAVEVIYETVLKYSPEAIILDLDISKKISYSFSLTH